MGKHEQPVSFPKLLRDERGVIYVEQILTVAAGLLIVGLLAVAGVLLFAPRFESITRSLYSGSP